MLGLFIAFLLVWLAYLVFELVIHLIHNNPMGDEPDVWYDPRFTEDEPCAHCGEHIDDCTCDYR